MTVTGGLFISTPNGKHNHFYDLVKLAQAQPDLYYYSHATSLDNPYIPAIEFENLRRQYEFEGKLDQFNQEFMAEFSNPQALIYGAFDYKTHVFEDLKKIPEYGTKNIGIDFGMTDPTAAIFVHIDLEGNWWIFDELYKTNLDLDPLINALRDKMGSDRYTRIIGDSRGKFEMESLRRRGFRITGAKKGADSIFNGIKEVQALLAVREGTGKPKLFVHRSCRNTIKEFEAYSWEMDDQNEVTNKPKEEGLDHAMDAIRYLALDKAKPVQREKRKRDYDPDTGRPLN